MERRKPTLDMWKRIVQEMRHEHDTGDGHFSTEEVEAVEYFVHSLEPKTHQASGADIQEFYEKGWDSNYYHDDSEIQIEDDAGNCMLHPDGLYDLRKFGMMIWQELGPDGENKTFEQGFEKWKASK